MNIVLMQGDRKQSISLKKDVNKTWKIEESLTLMG